MSNSAFSPSVLTVPSTGTTGSGQGELNLITNPVAAVNLDGWVGAGRGTSGGPLSPTIDTYFTVLNTAGSESSTTGAYDVLSLPSGLQNKKLKVEFYFTSPALDTFKVSVYKGTTRVPLTTDVSGSTALPQSTTGKFVAYFDTDSSGTWTVSITRTGGAGATALQFTNVVVGPGIQPQGAVVGEWQSYTPTGTWTTNTTYTGRYRRVGDSMDFEVKLVLAGAPNSTALYVNMPLGLTLDTTKIQEASGGNILGSTYILDAGVKDILGPVGYLSASQVRPQYADDAAAGVAPLAITQTAPITFGSSDTIIIRVDNVPIAEWAGSGTVQLAQNDVEFASNDGSAGVAANTAYTTGMVYGPSGSNFVAVASTTTNASTDYLVRFQTPVQNTDLIQIEAQDGTGTWNLISNYSASPIRTYQNQANSYYGLGWYRHPTVNTDIYVQFGNMGSGPNTTVSTAYAAAGNTWSGFTGRKWRVRKSSAGAAVGFGIVSPGVSSGLVSASGLPGNTTGNVVAAGYVGEVFSNTGTGVSVPTTGWTNIATITLTAGTWSIGTTTRAGGVVNATYLQSGIATASASSTGLVFGDTAGNVTISATADGSISLPNVIKTISASTQYWLVAQAGGATLSCAGRITAIRIA
jgi:hypothetical protein